MPAYRETRQDSLLHQRKRIVARAVTSVHPIFVVRAQESYVWDASGKQYLDLTGSSGLLNSGEDASSVLHAIEAQAERYVQTDFQIAMHEPYLRLADSLNKLAPGDSSKKTLLLTTRSDALAAAARIAQVYSGRPTVIRLAFSDKSHSAAKGAVPVDWQLNAEILELQLPFPTVDNAPIECVRQFAATNHVAAILVEPVLLQEGPKRVPTAFLQELRQLTERFGIVLIADETRTALGLLGCIFACELSRLSPDMVISGGGPMDVMEMVAVTGTAEIMDSVEPGGIQGSGGKPLACAVALAWLELCENEGLFEGGRRLGARLLQGIGHMTANLPRIGEIRAEGPLISFECLDIEEAPVPDPELAGKILSSARESGLLLKQAGRFGNLVMAQLPYALSDADLDQALDALQSALAHASTQKDGQMCN